MGVAIVTGIVTILAALLPVLVKWLDSKMEEPDAQHVLAEQQGDLLGDMATATWSGTGIDVATVWARHDRMLLESGIARPGAPSSGGGRDRNSGESGRNLHSDGGVDAPTSRIRARTSGRFATVRGRDGEEFRIELF